MDNKTKRLNYKSLLIILVLIGLLISCYFIFSESDEQRKERIEKEALDDLRKAREQSQKTEEDYLKAVEQAENAKKVLDKVQQETSINADELIRQIETNK